MNDYFTAIIGYYSSVTIIAIVWGLLRRAAYAITGAVTNGRLDI